MINGETVLNRTVTLNDKYTSKSDGDCTFSVKNDKPLACMSDIRVGNNIYSAVIAGCLDPDFRGNALLVKKPQPSRSINLRPDLMTDEITGNLDP